MRQNKKLLDPKPALIVLSPALITPLPDKFFVNTSPSKEAPKVPLSIDRKPPFCSFASFLIVSTTPFNSIPESLRDLTIFKMSFNSSFEIIKVVLLAPDPTFLCIKASVKLEAAVRPNNPNGLAAAFNNGNPAFNNSTKKF